MNISRGRASESNLKQDPPSSACAGSTSNFSAIQRPWALLNYHVSHRAANGTLVKICHFALGLIRISVVPFNEFDAFFVAFETAPDVRRVLFRVSGRVTHVELIAAAFAVVTPHESIGRSKRPSPIRPTRPTDNDDFG